MARRHLAPGNGANKVFRQFMSGVSPPVATLEPLVFLGREKYEMTAAMARDLYRFAQRQILESADLPLKILSFHTRQSVSPPNLYYTNYTDNTEIAT